MKGPIALVKSVLLFRAHSYGRVRNLFVQAGPICNFTSRLLRVQNLLYILSLSYLMCRNDIVFSMGVAPGKFQKQSLYSCAAKIWIYTEQ